MLIDGSLPIEPFEMKPLAIRGYLPMAFESSSPMFTIPENMTESPLSRE